MLCAGLRAAHLLTRELHYARYTASSNSANVLQCAQHPETESSRHSLIATIFLVLKALNEDLLVAQHVKHFFDIKY